MEQRNNYQVLKIVAWNPNGIRALVTGFAHEIQGIVQGLDPDIVIFNETKGNDSKQEEMQTLVNFNMPGYQWIWNNSQKAGQHGICMAFKPSLKPISVNLGFEDGVKEPEGRIITLELKNVYVVGIYGVNSGANRLQYKLEWFQRLWKYMNFLRSRNKPVVVTGDFNIAPQNIDVHDAEKCANSPGFLPAEKALFHSMEADGWIDLFRLCHPESKTWTWGCRTKSKDPTKDRKLYNGMRIDHAMIHKDDLINNKIMIAQDKNKVCQVMNLCKGSDHLPLVTQLVFNKTSKYHLPTVVCLKRTKDGVVVGCDVYIGRKFTMGGWNLQESIWANPHKLKECIDVNDCLSKYETHIRTKISKEWATFQPIMHNIVSQNRSITLGCFCKKTGPEQCHGDIIVKILSEYVDTLE